MMKSFTIVVAVAFVAATLHAQLTSLSGQLNDPANLAGERVSPQDHADTLPLNHGAPALQVAVHYAEVAVRYVDMIYIFR